MKIKRKSSGIIAWIMAFLMVCLFLVPENISYAKDSFLSEYMQTTYNQKNGIGSNEVNCLYQSSSGYIWIGTDGGLYRSNGEEFQSINLWDTDRTDVYSINCIIQDYSGRMWIGTDNYGLFYIENGNNFHLQEEYYNGIKSIVDVCQTDNGMIYVATGNGLFTCQLGDNGVMHLVPFSDEVIAGYEFSDIEAVGDEIWATYGNNKIYIIKGDDVSYVIDTSKIISDDINSMDLVNGVIYVGSTGRDIIAFSSRNKYSVITAGIEGINSVLGDSNGYLWVCADNGIGFFGSDMTFTKSNDCQIDSYLSDMIQDYEGNYWIASTRMGVLLLSRSKFSDFNMLTGMQETMTNCVQVYGNNKYIGTDDGLIIYDYYNARVNNAITDMLNGISIRHVMPDKKGNLWISTYRKYGVVKLEPDGTITSYGRSDNLPSMSVNCTLLLDNNNVAVATDEGIGIIDTKENAVIATYKEKDGLTYSNVTTLFQDTDGKLYAGTDGGGIYVINLNNNNITNYNTDSGLNSNTITSIEAGNEGIWIGTDNGLCFYNESFRAVSNIEYSNSIFDIVIRDEKVWIIGSMGVLCATEEELLGSQGLSGRYFNANDGLAKTINTISNTMIDRYGTLYICCNEGIATINTKEIPYNNVAPKIKVTAINVDGKRYEFDDLANGLKIGSDVSRITIDFAVFSFSNRNNIQVEYSLNGFDEEPIIISGNNVMQAVYTNLDGGVYEFVITAYNGDGVMCEETVSFTIEKETNFFEDPVARVGLITLMLLGAVLIVFGILRLRKTIVSNNKAIEKLSKEHEEAVKSSSAKNDYLANMSNEIKTPINAIMAKADEVLHTMSDEDEAKEKVKSIYDIGDQIIGKVDDIILLAKIEAGKIDVMKAPYSITTLIYDLSETAVKKIGDKSVKFFVELGEDITDNVIGDGEKIKNILDRLIDNAIKYTKEGSITLSVDCYKYVDKLHQDMVNVVFTVSDTGIGIQEDRLDSIFEIYNIADNKKNSLHSGNGVGLAIAKGYTSLMEGELEVESTYGAGSTFTLTVGQKTATRLSTGKVIAKIGDTVSKEIADKLWLPDVNVLLVDDEEVSREVSYKVLAQFEMKVDVASSGVNAIDMVMNSDYDVVFMDLSMPIMNGLDAMREIRELEDEKYIMLPIIAMDSDAIEENKSKHIEEGFTDSIVKPMDVRKVAAILKDCLPEDKIKEKSNDISKYVEGSRYSDGLYKLEEHIDVESAIEKIGGSIDVFNKLVVTFYNQNLNTAEELYEKHNKDIRGFKAKIHSLRTTSVNVGAVKLSQEAMKIEAAINIGNKEYINDNLEEFSIHLIDVLLAFEEYIGYMDSVSGITDEEYASKRAKNNVQEQEEVTQILSVEVLESIKIFAREDDFAQADKSMELLSKAELTGEDAEFIAVLKDAVKDRNADTVEELVNTYIDLKM